MCVVAWGRFGERVEIQPKIGLADEASAVRAELAQEEARNIGAVISVGLCVQLRFATLRETWHAIERPLSQAMLHFDNVRYNAAYFQLCAF